MNTSLRQHPDRPRDKPPAALLRAAVAAATLAAPLAASAAESVECAPAILAALGRHLHVARFTQQDDAGDPAAAVVASACKPWSAEPGVTLAAVLWRTGSAEGRGLVVAELDAAGRVLASTRDQFDEDAGTQYERGSLRLDTAAYALAPGVRAFGVDMTARDVGCGEGGIGPSRTLYVREGAALRPVLSDLWMQTWMYLRGNQPRCTGPDDKEEPLLETDDVSIGLGEPGAHGWRDLALTATAHRDDGRRGRKPLHVTLPYDGSQYALKAWIDAFDRWRR